MKKKGILTVVLIFVVVIVLTVSAYMFDRHRMKNNMPVIFSSWGHDYVPTIEKPHYDTNNSHNLYDKASEFLEKEFHRVYDPYYDIQGLTISNWEENENEATFFYKMTFIYYNRDPDTVEYIQKAKKRSQKEYEVLYNDYLEQKEANYEFKIIDNGENLELYSNVSPKGVEWEPTTIDEYIMK